MAIRPVVEGGISLADQRETTMPTITGRQVMNAMLQIHKLDVKRLQEASRAA